VAFTQDLSDEDKRGLSEQLTEEELAVFDILTKPEMCPLNGVRKTDEYQAETVLRAIRLRALRSLA